MPIYEYKCADCKHITEFLESYNNSGAHTCEKCKSSNMKRVISLCNSGSGGDSLSGSSCPTCNSSSCTSCGI